MKPAEVQQMLKNLFDELRLEAVNHLIAEEVEKLEELKQELKDIQLNWVKSRIKRLVLEPDQEETKPIENSAHEMIQEKEDEIEAVRVRLKKLETYRSSRE